DVWTNVTPTNTTLVIDVTDYSTVELHLLETSASASGVINFEGSTNASNYFGWPGVFMSQGIFTGAPLSQIYTYAFLGGANRAFTFNVSGLTRFQIRLSTSITTALSVTLRLTASAAAPVIALMAGPIGAQLQDPTTSTNVAAVKAASTAAVA